MKDSELSRRAFLQKSSIVAAGTVVGALSAKSIAAKQPNTSKILCYNPDMEYRRLGKTNMMVSAVCLGGHWKRINVMEQNFDRNRRDIVDRCMEVGINYIDACCRKEVLAYSRALKGRRDKMYMALSYFGKETRKPE